MVGRTKRGKEKGIIKKEGEKRWGRKERGKKRRNYIQWNLTYPNLTYPAALIIRHTILRDLMRFIGIFGLH